jgi:geranylgeranyl diphosphate synthase type I
MTDETAEPTFEDRLAYYKEILDSDINAYATKISQHTGEVYGSDSQMVGDTFMGILKRGGKRLRGALTIVGYEMCGGTDKAMILEAARAVEMMHAQMLIFDDIQDRAAVRRGGPSAHKMLEDSHQQLGWKGDAAHMGISLAINAAITGGYAGIRLLANLDVDAELSKKAVSIMSHTMTVTAEGQTQDMINELKERVSETDIENVLQWKTAHYSVLNPIHMGMVLAGAGCEDTNAITQYALNTGKAFQVTDDLLIVSESSDKNPIDDLREGKQTVLTVYAMEHASPTDAEFLSKCLGKQEVTEADFKRCQHILRDSGAVEHAERITAEYIKVARGSLQEHADRWIPKSVTFLDDLARYIQDRSA